MENNQSFLAELIKNAASIDDIIEFKKDAKKHSLNEWINIHKMKVGSAGFLTGMLGGPIGLVLETADMGYLGATMGRLCFGIGHIKNKPVNHNYDMEGILALWGGSAEGIKKQELENYFQKKYQRDIEKAYRKYLEEYTTHITECNKIRNNNELNTYSYENKKLSKLEFDEQIFQVYLSQIIINNKLIIDDSSTNISQNITATMLASTKIMVKSSSKVAIKVATKMILKKLGFKVSSKVLAKATAKLTAKAATKISTKWIPFVGGGTSAAINVWVLDTIATSAREYYKSDYIKIDSDI